MPRLPDRRRTGCIGCGRRRRCWLVKVRGHAPMVVPVCDECVFDLCREDVAS